MITLWSRFGGPGLLLPAVPLHRPQHAVSSETRGYPKGQAAVFTRSADSPNATGNRDFPTVVRMAQSRRRRSVVPGLPLGCDEDRPVGLAPARPGPWCSSRVSEVDD